jgi:putative sugar O-methyltransferase
MINSWAIHNNTERAYLTECMQAATNEEKFANFKQNPILNFIWEHVPEGGGKAYHKAIQSIHPIGNHFKVFEKNDLKGHPKKFIYNDWEISPTTLRYIFVLVDIQRKFNMFVDSKRTNLLPFDGQMNVVEIGGGYGGQCLVFKQWFAQTDYTIIDQPEVNELQKVYLSRTGVNANVISSDEYKDQVKDEYDLVISNYAYDELSPPARREYFDSVITKSKHGYLTVNNDKMVIANQIGSHFGFENVKVESEPEGVGKANIIWW